MKDSVSAVFISQSSIKHASNAHRNTLKLSNIERVMKSNRNRSNEVIIINYSIDLLLLLKIFFKVNPALKNVVPRNNAIHIVVRPSENNVPVTNATNRSKSV